MGSTSTVAHCTLQYYETVWNINKHTGKAIFSMTFRTLREALPPLLVTGSGSLQFWNRPVMIYISPLWKRKYAGKSAIKSLNVWEKTNRNNKAIKHTINIGKIPLRFFSDKMTAFRNTQIVILHLTIERYAFVRECIII